MKLTSPRTSVLFLATFCGLVLPTLTSQVNATKQSPSCGPLAWQFEVGQVHQFHRTLESTGQVNSEFRNHEEAWETWEIVSVEDQTALVEIRVDRIRSEATIGERTISFDSDISEPPVGDIGASGLRDLCLIGQPIQLLVTSHGEVLSVSAPDDFEQVNSCLETLRTDPDIGDDRIGEVAVELEQLANTNRWHTHFLSLSGREPVEGDEWSQERTADLFFEGRLTEQRTYRVMGVLHPNSVSVEVVDSSHNYEFPPYVSAFLRFNHAESSGNFTFDSCNGWLIESDLNFSYSCDIRLPDDPDSEWLQITFDQTITMERL